MTCFYSIKCKSRDEETQRRIFFVPLGEQHINVTDSDVEQTISDLNPALVIFDPIQSYMPLGVDMNNQVDVRSVLNRLIALAAKYNTTILYSQHMNKNSTQSALYRANGSNELTAASRAGVLLGKHPTDESMRVMAVTKANLVPWEHQRSVQFKIDTDFYPSLTWQGTTNLQADDICSVRRESVKPDEAPKRNNEAQVFIEDYLEKCGGYSLVSDVEKEASQCGISRATLYPDFYTLQAKKEEISHYL